MADQAAGSIPAAAVFMGLPNTSARGIPNSPVLEDLTNEASSGSTDRAIGEDDSSESSRGIAEHSVAEICPANLPKLLMSRSLYPRKGVEHGAGSSTTRGDHL